VFTHFVVSVAPSGRKIVIGHIYSSMMRVISTLPVLGVTWWLVVVQQVQRAKCGEGVTKGESM